MRVDAVQQDGTPIYGLFTQDPEIYYNSFNINYIFDDRGHVIEYSEQQNRHQKVYPDSSPYFNVGGTSKEFVYTVDPSGNKINPSQY